MRYMVSVVLIEDQRDVREGFQKIINSSQDFRCIACFEYGDTALEKIPLLVPDIVLMSIKKPHNNGIEITRSLKKEMPFLNIIMLSSSKNDEHIFQSLRAGATGYLHRDLFPSELIDALKEVRNGGAPMSKEVARTVVNSFSSVRKSTAKLSDREQEVLDLLCEGLNYRVIAERLFVSTNTIRFHLKNIYKKLDVNSKYEAVKKAPSIGMA